MTVSFVSYEKENENLFSAVAAATHGTACAATATRGFALFFITAQHIYNSRNRKQKQQANQHCAPMTYQPFHGKNLLIILCVLRIDINLTFKILRFAIGLNQHINHKGQHSHSHNDADNTTAADEQITELIHH